MKRILLEGLAMIVAMIGSLLAGNYAGMINASNTLEYACVTHNVVVSHDGLIFACVLVGFKDHPLKNQEPDLLKPNGKTI